MSSNGRATLKGEMVKILEEIPPGESRVVIFGVEGQLFKAMFGQFSTVLRLWTAEGWQLYYKWDRKYPEQDVYDFATKTAAALRPAQDVALATPRQ